MFEVLVIENSPDYNGASIATWTEVFSDYASALDYKEKMIFNEPLSYNRECITTLITNIHVEERCQLMEVIVP